MVSFMTLTLGGSLWGILETTVARFFYELLLFFKRSIRRWDFDCRWFHCNPSTVREHLHFDKNILFFVWYFFTYKVVGPKNNSFAHLNVFWGKA